MLPTSGLMGRFQSDVFLHREFIKYHRKKLLNGSVLKVKKEMNSCEILRS